MNILELIPKGKLWEGKNIRTLFLALGDSAIRAKNDFKNLLEEIFPDKTILFLPNWTKICDIQSREGVLGILAATGGNRDEFFLEIAHKYDPQCEILKPNPNQQFVAGISTAGMSLSGMAIPRFTIVFQFSVRQPLPELEKLLQKLKPAHVSFVYLYGGQKNLFLTH